ncbi:dynamin family protein [Hydrogenophilus thiooxidans]|uniref:dynamin family protein n=1 Tax=Hydrogenophilus thiooxidans TaxID=2820326 RepID=UPI001C214D9E|nr:dynamin family protein [Hydrogenophilus thiooxidans]
MALGQYLIDFDTWRGAVRAALLDLQQALTDAGVAGRERVRTRLLEAFDAVDTQRLRVAFLAEFSRGKTELINALFFANHGERVLPSRTGRTTMCPTELEWFDGATPEVLLLPIAAARDLTLRDARMHPELWTRRPFDPHETQSVLAATQGVSAVEQVSVDEAESLGFRIDPSGENGLEPQPDGSVLVPAWRHAIIRYPHPLLAAGLVIVDTPGLNAIGAEIDLTLSLLPECQAIVFVLGIDTGVTRSDIAVWRRFIHSGGDRSAATLVVLNKIDALEDGLRSGAEIEREIDERVADVAHHLGVSPTQIFPLSAQRALVGRIRDDEALVAQSRITEFEAALSEVLVDRRLEISEIHLNAALEGLLAATGIEAKLAQLHAQLEELEGLRSKNRARMLYLLKKVQSEKEELDALAERSKAAKTLFARDAKALLELIGRRRIRAEVERVVAALQQATFSAQMRTEIERFFDRISEWLEEGNRKLAELKTMVDKLYHRFETEYGLTCDPPSEPPQYEPFIASIQDVRQVALEQVAGWGFLLGHGKKRVIEQFASLVGREIEARWERHYRQFLAWVRVVMVPMDEALAEQAEALEKRMQGLERIRDSVDTLEPQIAALEAECQTWQKHRDRIAAAIDAVRAAAGL